jgi:hypothetical protein
MVIVVTRKHWIVFGILLVMQVPGIVLMISKSGIHVPAFFWPTIFGWVACSAFVTALILVALAGVFSQKKRRPSGTP